MFLLLNTDSFFYVSISLIAFTLLALIRSQYVHVSHKCAIQKTAIINEDVPGLNLLIVGQLLCLLLELDLCLLITIFLIMNGRCFVIVNTRLLISQRAPQRFVVCVMMSVSRRLMCQRQKSGHLSVPPHVRSIAMLPCPRHQRPALVTGGLRIATAPPGIIIHKNQIQAYRYQLFAYAPYFSTPSSRVIS